jgi:BirA family biotin operon repressor/biotin-[acetyl-CoA-carboxylase] ligase
MNPMGDTLNCCVFPQWYTVLSVKELALDNPFSAPVFYLDTTASTMLDAKDLAARGERHGAVVVADVQEAGRGRGENRLWKAEKGKNLLFTLLLRYPGIASMPPALTLRAGLALSLAIERIAPTLKGSLRVKWPNDVMLPVGGAYRKTAGILAESDGRCVYAGVGVNVRQTLFSEDLRNKAGSIALALGDHAAGLPENARFDVLAAFLDLFHADIEGPPSPWREQLEERLYLRGHRARFIAGAADAGRVVEGLLCGIGEGGELLIRTGGGIEAFVTGELEAYGNN